MCISSSCIPAPETQKVITAIIIAKIGNATATTTYASEKEPSVEEHP